MQYSEQTISDCILLPSGQNPKSILQVFDYTRTSGGGDCLRKMITTKLTSVEQVEEMQHAIRYAADNTALLDFEIINAELQYIMEYFRLNNSRSGPTISFFRRLKYRFTNDAGYFYTRSNVTRILFFLRGIRKKMPADTNACPKILKDIFDRLRVMFEEPVLSGHIDRLKLNITGIIKADFFLQRHFKVLFDEMMDNLYRLDAIVSAGKACKKHSLEFPVFSTTSQFVAGELYHLLIRDAVSNDLLMESGKNVLFLTGANMAGKSSFLRSVGSVVCLAHAGFPVPAKKLVTPFFEEISVNISVQDDMSKGYSRFYNEILSVKNLLQQLAAGKKCFAIFDEIFSGTNFNDAVSCSKMLLGSLKGYNDSLVMISSHNMQLAGEGSDNMQFNFIDSGIEDGRPVFSFKLKPGKSETALGLFLFEQMHNELQNATRSAAEGLKIRQ